VMPITPKKSTFKREYTLPLSPTPKVDLANDMSDAIKMVCGVERHGLAKIVHAGLIQNEPRVVQMRDVDADMYSEYGTERVSEVHWNWDDEKIGKIF